MRYKDYTAPEYWKKFFSSSYIDEYREYEEFFNEHLPQALKSQDFWWKDLFGFYTHLYQQKTQDTKPFFTFSYKRLQSIISHTGLNVNIKDRGGNTYIHYLISQAFEPRSGLHIADEEIPQFVGLLENPLEKNNLGHTFFWFLNTVLYTHFKAKEKLLPFIKKYNINVLEKDNHDYDLFEKAVNDNLEDSIVMYMELGASIEKRKSFLANFLFAYWPTQKIKGPLFQQALQLYDPFDNLVYKKTQYKAESLMESWISFLKGNSQQQHIENIIEVCSLIQENKVRLKLKNAKKITSTLNDLKKQIIENNISSKNMTYEKLLQYVEATKICSEKYFLNQKMKKNNNLISFKKTVIKL